MGGELLLFHFTPSALLGFHHDLRLLSQEFEFVFLILQDRGMGKEMSWGWGSRDPGRSTVE